METGTASFKQYLNYQVIIFLSLFRRFAILFLPMLESVGVNLLSKAADTHRDHQTLETFSAEFKFFLTDRLEITLLFRASNVASLFRSAEIND